MHTTEQSLCSVSPDRLHVENLHRTYLQPEIDLHGAWRCRRECDASDVGESGEKDMKGVHRTPSPTLSHRLLDVGTLKPLVMKSLLCPDPGF